MKKVNREPLLWLVAVTLASVAAGWSVLERSGAEAEAGYAAADAEQAAKYALKIQEFRASTDTVDDHELETTLVAQLIEHAADRAQISRQALDRVWPRPSRRIDDGPYQQKSTQVVVREVTLPQAVTFLHHLTDGPRKLRVDGLRLSAPRDAMNGDRDSPGSTPETWMLEATISQLIYNPAPAPRVARRD